MIHKIARYPESWYNLIYLIYLIYLILSLNVNQFIVRIMTVKYCIDALICVRKLWVRNISTYKGDRVEFV